MDNVKESMIRYCVPSTMYRYDLQCRLVPDIPVRLHPLRHPPHAPLMAEFKCQPQSGSKSEHDDNTCSTSIQHRYAPTRETL